MVPQAIALRRCRYCMVLVSGSGTSWRVRGKVETDHLLPWPHPPGLPDPGPDLPPSSLPSLLVWRATSVEPD